MLFNNTTWFATIERALDLFLHGKPQNKLFEDNGKGILIFFFRPNRQDIS